MGFYKTSFDHYNRTAGAYDPSEDYSGKYMTAFYFEDSHGVPYCHCTHHYLAEQDPKTVHDIISTIDLYFSKMKPVVKTPWAFDNFELFGAEADVPVMTRSDTSDMMLDLKAELEPFKEDKFPVYRPHITLGDKVQELTIDRLRPLGMKVTEYALVSGNQKIKSWNLTG